VTQEHLRQRPPCPYRPITTRDVSGAKEDTGDITDPVVGDLTRQTRAAFGKLLPVVVGEPHHLRPQGAKVLALISKHNWIKRLDFLIWHLRLHVDRGAARA